MSHRELYAEKWTLDVSYSVSLNNRQKESNSTNNIITIYSYQPQCAKQTGNGQEFLVATGN